MAYLSQSMHLANLDLVGEVHKIEQKLKLQGGTLSAIEIGTKAIRKFGTMQLTGVYGAKYNLFPLGNMFERNITLRMG